ncbi:MAG: dTDP-4-dehydrorhamnose 3,5-epimerase family protein [Bacteriovoracaceae bacterium]|nr:dTDP-4-dehydrorhamnose 3,5-epimerase family protein [Bacteriovoracaceae bacterium]
MKIIDLNFGGLKKISLDLFQDERGSFIKTYNSKLFQSIGINFNIEEEFFSTSNKDVIRGFHFQLPPFDHDKIVRCLTGEVLDVVIDLRKTSINYKKHLSINLNAEKNELLFIPRGFAHGFLSKKNNTTMQYFVNSIYSKDHDSGIRYDTIGFDWGIKNPIVSSRDLSFTTLESYRSEFE